MAQRPEFSEAFPIIAVDDLATTLAFYRDLLGFSVDYRWPTDGEIEFAYLTLGANGLGLGRKGEQHRQTGAPFAGNGVSVVDLCLYVADLDHAIAWLRERGTPILIEPIDQPWGERTAYVADPSGTQLLLIQSPPAD